MSKIICFLPICLKPTNPQSGTPSFISKYRNKQYIEGLKSFFKYYDILKNNNIKVIIFDNNLESKDKIPDEILSLIPEGVTIKASYANTYGKINKGAGLIEAWLHNIDEIKEYDYLVHFEPRQVLNSFYFINNFLSDNRNIFTCRGKENINRHFNTGLFTIKTTELLKFISIYTPEKMVRERLSIEYILYNFYKKNKLEHSILDKMDLFWFPAWGGKSHW